MCNWMSMLIDRNGKVWYDGNETSHEKLVEKSGWKDNKLANRDFVRIEIAPNTGTFSANKTNWEFKVDEQGTLPEWYLKNQKKNEALCWALWKNEIKRCNIAKIEKFIASFKKVKWFKPDGNPKPEWNVFYGKEWDAAWSAARDAARDAAWSAARDAAWSAARDAARDAAWGAARLMADIILLGKDCKLEKKHIEHIQARWEVWKKGYMLLCDIEGVLYVYAPESARPKMKVKK